VAGNLKGVKCTLSDGRVLRVTKVEPRNAACYETVHRNVFFGMVYVK